MLPSFEKLDGDRKTDVLIIGGGMAGVLCAYALSKKGVDYLLVEADRIGQGVTGCTTAKITAQHGLIYDALISKYGTEKARMYLEANLLAVQRYREWCAQIDCDFAQKDNFVYASEMKKLEIELLALEKLGYPAQFVKDVPLPLKTAGAVGFACQAQFHPLKFLAGIAKGLRIYEHTRVTGYDGKAFLTEHGRITARKAIVATHFPIFNKHGLYPLKQYQHRSYVLALKNAAAVPGMYVDEKETGLSFRMAGDMLLLGGGDHRTGKQGGNWAELEQFAKVHWPGAQIQARWAAQDCMSLDGVPYIGPYSRHAPDIFVATGFNKWGMTSSMVAAQILCDQVQDRENPFAPVFSPQRSIWHAQLALNALETTVNLLTPTRPRCPHLGCALKWNKTEHSWDCPCHGSRFSAQGVLLDNPATADMKK